MSHCDGTCCANCLDNQSQDYICCDAGEQLCSSDAVVCCPPGQDCYYADVSGGVQGENLVCCAPGTTFCGGTNSGSRDGDSACCSPDTSCTQTSDGSALCCARQTVRCMHP